MSPIKMPKLSDYQRAAHHIPNDDEDGNTGTMIELPETPEWWRKTQDFFQHFPEHAAHFGNLVLNFLTVAVVVAAVSALSIVGDRFYLQYTDTGSSRFEAYLKQRGYHQQALAYRQQRQACMDSSNSLEVCTGAAWLYLHPEIAVWPEKTKQIATVPMEGATNE